MILFFSLPVLLGNLFQQLYSMVDTIIVGRFVGTQALAAVGSTSAISFLVLGFSWGVTGGFTVIITVLALLTAKPLLRLMNTPQALSGHWETAGLRCIF